MLMPRTEATLSTAISPPLSTSTTISPKLAGINPISPPVSAWRAARSAVSPVVRQPCLRGFFSGEHKTKCGGPIPRTAATANTVHLDG